MRAGIEDDVLLLRQAFVNIDREVEQVPKWRHRADLTVGEQSVDLRFGRQSNPIQAKVACQLVEINHAIGRQYRDRIEIVAAKDYRLGELIGRQVFGGGDVASPVRIRMVGMCVGDQLPIQK